MKKMILMTLLSLGIAAGAHAEQNNSLGGLIIGAGGGALAGQAIGRNTEATVIGTAVGGVIGYIIGSEMDKNRNHPEQVYYDPAPPVVYHETRVAHYNTPDRYRRHQPPAYRACKKAEIRTTVHGRPRTIHGTVCRTPHGWKLVSQERHHNGGLRLFDNRRPGHDDRRDHDWNRERSGKQHWLRH